MEHHAEHQMHISVHELQPITEGIGMYRAEVPAWFGKRSLFITVMSDEEVPGLFHVDVSSRKTDTRGIALRGHMPKMQTFDLRGASADTMHGRVEELINQHYNKG